MTAQDSARLRSVWSARTAPLIRKTLFDPSYVWAFRAPGWAGLAGVGYFCPFTYDTRWSN